jgi:hypothetical protein
MKIWKTLEADPLFQHPQSALSVDEQQHLATRQMYRIKQYNFLPLEDIIADIRKVGKYALMHCTGLQQGKLHNFIC